jgi:hypothetical protein
MKSIWLHSSISPVIVTIFLSIAAIPAMAVDGSSEYQVFGSVPADSLINLYQWRTDQGGNNHWYAILPVLLSWPEADSAARTLENEGMTGYLATVTSRDENYFILCRIMADIISPSFINQFWLGGYYLKGSWRWVTSEEFSYTNWGLEEPDNLPVEWALVMQG